MYTKDYDSNNNLIGIKRDDGAYIPISEENRDYKMYLEDVEEGAEVIDDKLSDDELLSNLKVQAILSKKKHVESQFLEGFDFDGNHFGMKAHDQRNYDSACVCVLNGFRDQDYVQIEPFGIYEINSSNAKDFHNAATSKKNEIVSQFENDVAAIMSSSSIQELEDLE